MVQMIVTAVGNDRPGLVGELTGHLHAAGANILDSRMVNLRGRFAVMVLLEAKNGDALKRALPPAAEKMGLVLTFSDHGAALPAAAKGMPYKLKTYSLDQPGLVHRISEVLRNHQVNIEDLRAHQESAAFAGDPLFTLQMQLTVPAHVQVKQLRSDLDAVCEKLNADLDLEPAEI